MTKLKNTPAIDLSILPNLRMLSAQSRSNCVLWEWWVHWSVFRLTVLDERGIGAGGGVSLFQGGPIKE
jgi:hypothetical protein